MVSKLTRRGLILAGLLLLLAALLVISGLVAGALLSGSAKDRIAEEFGRALGVPVTLGGISIDLGEWVQLSPALTIADVTLGNPPGFRTDKLLTAKEVQGQADLLSVFSGRPRIRRVEIIGPVVTLERNDQGITNLEALIRKFGTNARPGEPGDTPGDPSAAGITVDEAHIVDGELRTLEVGGPGESKVVVLRNLAFDLVDFAPGKPIQTTLSAALYEGTVSGVQFSGTVGPPEAVTLPAQGALRLKLAPAELPESMMSGVRPLVGNPSPEAVLYLSAELSGDLFDTLIGPLSLSVEALAIGPDPENTLLFSGKTSGQVSVRRPLSRPIYQVELPEMDFQLGSGRLKASSRVSTTGERLEGHSKGSIEGVDIQKFLAVFHPRGLRVQGTLTVPAYSVQFTAAGPANLEPDLKGTAAIEVKNGWVEGMDILTSIQTALDQSSQQASGGGRRTDFATLTANAALDDRNLTLSEIVIDSPAGRIRGQGTVSEAATLNLQVRALVTGKLAQLLGRSANEEVAIPVNITGPVSDPVVRPDFGKVAQETGMNYLIRLLAPPPKQQKKP